MVKIINTLGDVKVGKQGTAIYQRKYGQQIRSVTSVMRGIPSETQLNHRQSFRDALAWRKSLSRQNRRYLDGYPIANGLIDKYGIPLPWSRFALKLYLEHIQFVIIEQGIVFYYPPPEEHTEEHTSITTQYPIYNGYNERFGQALNVPDRVVSKLSLAIYRQGSPTGDITFTIRDYSTDAIVASKVWGDAADLPTSPAFREVEFDEPAVVNGWHRLLCEFYGGDVSNNVQMEFHHLGLKAGEYAVKWIGGVYTPVMPWDMGYIYTYLVGEGEEGKIDWTKSKLGLIHVRHPALMSGEHRRDGKLLEQWGTLSSLDDEYLTGQVGVDVLPDDELLFTTITGRQYTYKVP